MKRSLAAAAAACLALAGCGGHHHHAAPQGRYNASVHPPGWGAPIAGPNGLVSPNFGLTVAPTATMYDSVTLSQIPADGFAAAGYTSGLFTTWPSLVSGFPNAHKISIAINDQHAAMCLDVEPGDAVPSQVVGWIRFDIQNGFPHPCVYSSLFEYLNQIKPLVEQAGLWNVIFKWDADYTFIAHIDAGFDATQWTDKCLNRNLDCSLVTLPFLSIATPPLLPTPPGPSPATITHWRQARNSSFSVYHDNYCKTLVDNKTCRLLGGRVEYFQGKLWTVFSHWGCWGRHAKTKSEVCWVVRPTVSRWSQARDATARAQSRNGCVVPASFGAPSHSRLCDELDQRERFFARLVAAARKEYA